MTLKQVHELAVATRAQSMSQGRTIRIVRYVCDADDVRTTTARARSRFAVQTA